MKKITVMILTVAMLISFSAMGLAEEPFEAKFEENKIKAEMNPIVVAGTYVVNGEDHKEEVNEGPIEVSEEVLELINPIVVAGT